MESNIYDFDDLMDEANEYNIFFGFVNDLGLATENELKFNGEVEAAKRYQESSLSEFIDLYSNFDSSVENSIKGDDKSTLSCSNDSNSICAEGDSLKSHSRDSSNCDNQSGDKSQFMTSSTPSGDVKCEMYPLALYSEPKDRSTISTYQQPRETRIKYLLRFPRLMQEFSNAGDFDKLMVLFNDVFIPDCLLLTHAIPPILGREKICQLLRYLQRGIPDYFVMFSNVVRTKRRLITMKGNSFGTFPFANSNTKSFVDPFENVPIETFDEYHQAQKQIYDTLKSQSKDIKFERRVTWYLVLSKDRQHIEKMMACNSKIDLFSGGQS